MRKNVTLGSDWKGTGLGSKGRRCQAGGTEVEPKEKHGVWVPMPELI
jgi:hypothetical protein